MRDDKAEFDGRHTAILGVNPGSQASHRRYADKQGLTFPLLTDGEGKVAKTYGARGLAGLNRRTVVLVDKAGVIRYYQRGLPSDAEILATIDALGSKGA